MTTILALHIVLMSASLVATSVMTIAAAASMFVRPSLVRANALMTGIGVLAGVVMIAQNPIGIRCAALFAYLAAFSAAYVYVRRKNQLLATLES